MSVDFPGALPSWKLALIERKRRQDLDYHHPRGPSGKPGAEPTAAMPPWKQELLSRKQQKRLAGAKGYGGEIVQSHADFPLSPEDSKKCGGVFDPWPTMLSPGEKSSAHGTGLEDKREFPLEERLLPIHKNPILLMDMDSRMPSGVSQRSGFFAKLSRLGVSSHMSFDGDAAASSASRNSRYDEGFDEEEVIYGKGFVSRLLQKFSHLSGRGEVFSSGPHFSRSLSRGQSSEDFLDGRYDCRPASTRPPRRKSSSLDDLLKDNSNSRLASENGDVNESDGDCICWPSQGGEGSMVVSVRNIFESLATSPTFAKECTLRARRSTSPERSENPNVPDEIGNGELQTEASPNSCSSSSKSWQEENLNVKTIAQPRTTIDDSFDFYERQASLFRPGGYKPPAVVNTGVDLISPGDVTDDEKIDAQISSFKTETSVHYVADLPADNNLTTENMAVAESGCEPSELKMSAGDSQIHQKYEGRISPNSLSKQSASDCLEPAERDSSADIPFPSGQSAAAKKTPPRPGLLLIRPASNLSNIKTDYLQLTRYNDIRHGDFVPAKKPAQKGVQVEDSDSDEFEESIDVSKYLDNVRFEFEGAGICPGRSLLAKSKKETQLKTCFDDAATVIFEYPSEQSLVDAWPPDVVDMDCSSGHNGDQSLLGAGLTSDAIIPSADPSKTEVDLTSCIKAAGQRTVVPCISSQDMCVEGISKVSNEKPAFSGTVYFDVLQ